MALDGSGSYHCRFFLARLHQFAQPRKNGVQRQSRAREFFQNQAFTRSFDEFIAVEILERRLSLDDSLGQVEVLQLREPFRIDLAEPALTGVDQCGVIGDGGLNRTFLALPFRNESIDPTASRSPTWLQ